MQISSTQPAETTQKECSRGVGWMCELNGDGDDVPYFKNVTLVNTIYMNKKALSLAVL